MPKGTVKFFNEAKGIGFIKSSEGKELQVHVSSLIEQIRVGDSVTFEVGKGPKGPMALNVRLA